MKHSQEIKYNTRDFFALMDIYKQIFGKSIVALEVLWYTSNKFNLYINTTYKSPALN